LIRAALDLIAEKGPSGFTFAEAARFAGVSPAAPYRHFRDRDELLASVALRGFAQFEAALVQAWNEGTPDPITAFERMGRAYLDFARSEPAYYSAMFEAGLSRDVSQSLRDAGDRAFAVIRTASEQLSHKYRPASARRPSWWRSIFGLCPMASLRCSGAAMPAAAASPCRRRNCWKRAFLCISAVSDCRAGKAILCNDGRRDGLAVGKARITVFVSDLLSAARAVATLTSGRRTPIHVNVINIHTKSCAVR
jgi:AcrR family transcriptional regulator